MDRLPDDALAGILRRLFARDLASCRCVCKEWRRAIDGRGLLAALRNLLPQALHGIFVNYNEHAHSHLFARTPARPEIDGMLDFMPRIFWRTVVGHCNGLLIYEDDDYYVCNPATRRWARLPPERMKVRDYVAPYLVFDPAASLQYEVCLLPDVTKSPRDRREEWPPASYKMDVFSSSARRWQDRLFVRHGESVATVADVLLDDQAPAGIVQGPQFRYAVYWRGALYVHCRGSFLTRLSLSDNTYRVIKTPSFPEESKEKNTTIVDEDEEDMNSYFRTKKTPYLGRSKNGVYYAVIHQFQLRVWSLNELHGLMEWEHKYNVDLLPFSRTFWYGDLKADRTWILQDYHSATEKHHQHARNEEADQKNSGGNIHNNIDTEGQHNFDWDSDDDYTLDLKDSTHEVGERYFEFLGFHPYKEVIFLGQGYHAVAYHLGSAKTQYIVHFHPRKFGSAAGACVLESFPYTACFIDALAAHD